MRWRSSTPAGIRTLTVVAAVRGPCPCTPGTGRRCGSHGPGSPGTARTARTCPGCRSARRARCSGGISPEPSRAANLTHRRSSTCPARDVDRCDGAVDRLLNDRWSSASRSCPRRGPLPEAARAEAAPASSPAEQTAEDVREVVQPEIKVAFAATAATAEPTEAAQGPRRRTSSYSLRFSDRRGRRKPLRPP